MDSSIIETLNTADPQAYNCKVWSYLVSHLQLLIRSWKDDFLTGDTFYLLFIGVLYFDGPTIWKSAEFYLGTSDECFKLLQEKRGYNDTPEHRQIAEKTHLFKVETSRGVIRILASNVYKSKDIPPDFFWLRKSDN
jgi:hypothetical protein